MKNKSIFKIVSLMLLLVVSLLTLTSCVTPYEVDYDGSITVEVVDLDGNIVKSKTIDFHEGDILRDLVASNFDNFVMEESQYGAYVFGIETIKQDDDARVYVALYVNGAYATSGLDTLEYHNGDTITFKAESW